MKKSILEVVHETAKGFYDAGLMDVKTMYKFDAMCLPPVRKFTPKKMNKPFKLLRQKMSKSAQKAARTKTQHLLKEMPLQE